MAEKNLSALLDWLKARNPDQPEFIQAVQEVYSDVKEISAKNSDYIDGNILQRLAEPERVISFHVCWEDDKGNINVNRGYRVQHCGVLGPFKGGIRFHSTVNESVLKFLAFEQTFKNALLDTPLGGAKGGSDFDPKDRSDREIQRFCQAFMNELHRHIGANTDVPAGDINVGSREIGYLFGHYRRLANEFSGAMTGKDIDFGGSCLRPEATGFGLIFFIAEMLQHKDQSLEDKVIAISGSGNVALHAALKAIQEGARVITLSNSEGCLYVKSGFQKQDIEDLINSSDRPDLATLAKDLKGEWNEGSKPWIKPCDIALPCATQNELEQSDADALINNDCEWLAEGANMPCTSEAIATLNQAKVHNAPGKASNAGGVALSGLEMMQNASFNKLSCDELDDRLHDIMTNIHAQCVSAIDAEAEWINYRKAANLAAFRRVADALLAQGF